MSVGGKESDGWGVRVGEEGGKRGRGGVGGEGESHWGGVGVVSEYFNAGIEEGSHGCYNIVFGVDVPVGEL